MMINVNATVVGSKGAKDEASGDAEEKGEEEETAAVTADADEDTAE